MSNVEKKLLFVLNPISGGIDKTQFRQQLDAACLDAKVYYEVMETTGEDDKNRIQKAIATHRPDCVVACGGDGTINLVAQTLLGTDTPLGIVPLGSANGMATELLIPKKLDENIEMLLSGDVIEMDVLLVNDEHFCLHLADVGFNAKLVQEFDEAKGRGKFTYALSFAKTIIKKEGVRCRIQLPKRIFKKTIEMIVFANATKYGTGALVNPTGKIDDGCYELCVFQPYPRWQLLHLTWLFFSGRLERSPYVDIHHTSQASITFARPLPLQIDGELIGDVTEVAVRIHPKKLTVIVPTAYASISD